MEPVTRDPCSSPRFSQFELVAAMARDWISVPSQACLWSKMGLTAEGVVQLLWR